MRLHTATLDRHSPITKQYIPQGGWGGGMGSTYGGPTLDQKSPDMDASSFRGWRAGMVWAAAAVDIRSDEVINARKSIVPRDKDAAFDPLIAQQIMAWLQNPDPKGTNYSWAGWMGPLVEDCLILGKGAFRKWFETPKRKRGQGKRTPVEAMLDHARTINAAAVEKNPKWDPEKNPDVPRYIYRENPNDKDGEPLTNAQLMLIEPRPLSYSPTGLSPMKYLHGYLWAHQDTFKSLHRIQRNRQPPGVLKIPSARPGTVDKFRRMWSRIEGRGQLAVVDVPADSDFIKTGENDVGASGSFEFIDIIVRGVSAAFQISTVALGWTQTTLERGAAEQGIYQDRGIINLLWLIQDYLNRELLPDIVRLFTEDDNYRLEFTDLPLEDEAEDVAALAQQAEGRAWVPMIDLMGKAGLEPPEYDESDWVAQSVYEDPWFPALGGAGSLPGAVWVEEYKAMVKQRDQAAAQAELQQQQGQLGLAAQQTSIDQQQQQISQSDDTHQMSQEQHGMSMQERQQALEAAKREATPSPAAQKKSEWKRKGRRRKPVPMPRQMAPPSFAADMEEEEAKETIRNELDRRFALTQEAVTSA